MLADIADIIIDIYAVESAIARAEKISASRGDRRGWCRTRRHPVFATDAADRMTRSARQIARALATKGHGHSIASLRAPLASFEGIDGVAARQAHRRRGDHRRQIPALAGARLEHFTHPGAETSDQPQRPGDYERLAHLELRPRGAVRDQLDELFRSPAAPAPSARPCAASGR